MWSFQPFRTIASRQFVYHVVVFLQSRLWSLLVSAADRFPKHRMEGLMADRCFVLQSSSIFSANAQQVGFMIMAPSLSSTEISCRYKQNDSGIGIKIAAAIDTNVDAPNRYHAQKSALAQAGPYLA